MGGGASLNLNLLTVKQRSCRSFYPAGQVNKHADVVKSKSVQQYFIINKKSYRAFFPQANQLILNIPVLK